MVLKRLRKPYIIALENHIWYLYNQQQQQQKKFNFMPFLYLAFPTPKEVVL